MLIHIKQLFAQGDFNLTSHQLDEVTGNVKMTVTITGKGGVTQQQGMFSLYAYPTVRQHTPNTQARGGNTLAVGEEMPRVRIWYRKMAGMF